MKRAPDLTSTIVVTERLTNSVSGNPRFRVTFADGTVAQTQSDSSYAYDIENLANPRHGTAPLVNVWLTRAGRLEAIEKVAE